MGSPVGSHSVSSDGRRSRGSQHRVVALALLMLVGVMVWVTLTPFDPNGSLQYGLAVTAPFVTIAVVLGTTIVTLTKPALWLCVAGVASAVIAVSLAIGALSSG